MLYKQIKDKLTRKQLKKNEIKRLASKYSFVQSLARDKHIRRVCVVNSRTFSSVKIRRRCVLTNRSRGVQTSYNISRIKLRELLQFGILPGYKKAV